VRLLASSSSWRRPAAAPVAALRQRLALQRPLTEDDGSGGTTRDWQTIAWLWAAVTPVSGGWARREDMVSGHLLLRVEMRHRPDVRPGMRFRAADGTLLLIEAVADPDGRRRRLVCQCRRQPA
jgi:SPP1 family predicted phage head-tail adaptor